MKYKSVLLLIVISLALASFTIAEEFPGLGCITDLDCQEVEDIIGEGAYCNPLTEECATPDGSVEELPFEEDSLFEEPLVLENNSETTQTVSSGQLETEITVLQKKVDSLEGEKGDLQQQLNSINSNLQSLSNQLEDIKEVKTELNSISTGLATLQEELDQTTTELGTIEEDIKKKETRNKTLIIIFFVLLAIAAALAMVYYITRQRSTKKVDPKIVDYITKQIKKGKKYPHIKNLLKKAGWAEEEIKLAYKKTIKDNYKKYLSRTGTVARVKNTKVTSQKDYDKKKMFAIIGVSVLLLAGVLLILNGTVGEAVYFEKLVGGVEGGTNGKVTYKVECTSPHLLNPTEDGCCLDINANEVCDYIEAKEASLEQTSGTCHDNLQCAPGEYCINTKCTELTEFYNNQECEQTCNFYGLKVSATTYIRDESYLSCAELNYEQKSTEEVNFACKNNKQLVCAGEKVLIEEYNVKANQGSYTAAGALEWKVLPMPDHCLGEETVVPINVLMKDGGKILSESAIVLKKDQISNIISHPNLVCVNANTGKESPRVEFTLAVEEIYQPIGC
ncbi:hypothetical protein HOE37_04745 [Candidatus Woesearchaeota archaeon]|jgi:TolA-binding protein|nr:hypothetical protein [Candidatus Woesearchaeota archaeon]MBT4111140.1 hypothetical protein [Candidatus Woesearchaeota archaeon]MBT4336513.1 hypothetical protein [Candidatus Woesearchaeota archaeon]MBT4469389.1 hypothetical protein [Candidatus Woesearchaeota archaeon]MBT6744216.1 hypothetical protein [Candidatus Woesearchaeota archaeon]